MTIPIRTSVGLSHTLPNFLEIPLSEILRHPHRRDSKLTEQDNHCINTAAMGTCYSLRDEEYTEGAETLPLPFSRYQSDAFSMRFR